MQLEAPGPVPTLIVDDEPLARRALRQVLSADPEIILVGECKSGKEALAWLRRSPPALLLLDIQMPGMDGFAVLKEVNPPLPVVVFVTAHDEHALKAFEVHALDYVLKPFTDRRLLQAVARARAEIRKGLAQQRADKLAAMLQARGPLSQREVEPVCQNIGSLSGQTNGAGVLERIALREGGRVVVIAVDDIDWIGAEDYYVEIHVRGTGHLLRESLSDLEMRLCQGHFFRIHRSVIVNLRRIAELRPLFGGEHEVVLHDGTALRLSRHRRAALLAKLGL